MYLDIHTTVEILIMTILGFLPTCGKWTKRRRNALKQAHMDYKLPDCGFLPQRRFLTCGGLLER